VDLKIVGVLGPSAVAAITTGNRLFFVIQAVLIAVTTGTTALVARRIGEKNVEGAVRGATAAVALGSRRTAAASSALAWGTMGTGLLAGELTPILWGALAAALLALRPEPESRAGDSWNTLTIRLQLLFLVLLAPQTPAPLVVAIVIGGAAEGYNRWRWGVGYPFRAVGSERGVT